MTPLEDLFGEDVSTGFGITGQLIHESLLHDRKNTALVAVLTERMILAERAVGRLLQIIEQGNSHPGLVTQLATMTRELEEVRRGRDHRDQLATTLQQLSTQVEELKRGTGAVHVEGVRGKWAAIGMMITAGSGVILGLINLLK